MASRHLPDAPNVYRDLADHYDQIGQASMRDRFLILAADAALTAGLVEEAERLRVRLLSGSRHHMLKPFGSFAQAATSPDVQTYIHDLRANYPVETATALLHTLREGSVVPATPVPPAPPSHYPAQPVGGQRPVVDRWASGGHTVPTSVPGTAPVIDLDSQPALPASDPPFPAPVARPVRPRAQPRPAGPASPGAPATGRSSPLPLPPTAPPPPPYAPQPYSPPPPPPASQAPRRAPRRAPVLPPPVAQDNTPRAVGGAWLSVLLGLVALAAAGACAAFTFGKAFWGS